VEFAVCPLARSALDDWLHSRATWYYPAASDPAQSSDCNRVFRLSRAFAYWAAASGPNGATSRAPPNMQRLGRAGQSDRSSIARSSAGRPPSDSSLSGRATHARFHQRPLRRPSGRGRRRPGGCRCCSVQGSRSGSGWKSEPRPARLRREPQRARPEERARPRPPSDRRRSGVKALRRREFRHRSRKRECAARRAGASKRDRGEDAERDAAQNLECGHRNLRMRAWARLRRRRIP
jgi:hypothetical protein